MIIALFYVVFIYNLALGDYSYQRCIDCQQFDSNKQEKRLRNKFDTKLFKMQKKCRTKYEGNLQN